MSLMSVAVSLRFEPKIQSLLECARGAEPNRALDRIVRRSHSRSVLCRDEDDPKMLLAAWLVAPDSRAERYQMVERNSEDGFIFKTLISRLTLLSSELLRG